MSESATVITDVAAAVEIPEEGTLSRVLHDDDRIRVVAFAFDTGQELTEHTAALPAVLQVVSGRLRLTLGTEETTAGPGAWVHMAAGLAHSVVAEEPSVMLLTLLRGA